MDNPFKDTKLLIGVPNNTGMWTAAMSLDFALMIHATTCYAVPFHVQAERGSILQNLRQRLVDQAVRDGATHLLFIDTDQTFPHELAVRWLQADRPVIAANIATKGFPSYPTAKLALGRPHYSDVATEKFTKVDKIGTGLMMLQRAVFANLPRPAFDTPWKGDTYQGEDWTLCEHIKKAGFDIYVDNELSCKVGHVGQEIYSHGHIALTRQQDNAEAA